MEQTIKFSENKFVEYSNDQEFAIGKLLFLSTRPNSHNIPITEELLRKYGKTIVGKWVVAEYDKFRMDATTHTNNQHIVGIIPLNAEIEFVKAEDGYLDAYVDCVISKIYATDVYEIFVDDNHRNVSVEMIVGYNDNKEVTSLNITAVTILGRKYKPSVPNASIELTRFSEEKANQFYVKNKIDSFIENRKNLNNKIEGGNMVENKEILENQETIVEEKLDEVIDEREERIEEIDDKDDRDDVNDTDDDKDDSVEEEEKEETIEEEEKVDYEALLAEKDNVIQEKDNIIMEQNAELEALRAFKEKTEKFQKDEIVKTTLAKVKDKMSKETYESFEAEAENCSFADIEMWKNKVLANIADTILSKDENEGLLKFATNQVVDNTSNKAKGLWERL